MTLPFQAQVNQSQTLQAVHARLPRIHGGPDSNGAAQFDFSTNCNACGPCPAALLAVQQANATQYPDAGYKALRAQLAAFHAVDVERLVLATSASEFIFRITAVVAGRGGRCVGLPRHSYGDYSHAASAYGLSIAVAPMHADLHWACEPSSPSGAAHDDWPVTSAAIEVLDRAYEPLRLDGQLALPESQLQTKWQLFSPNKALGLTGVRAAYAIAPLDAAADIAAMNRLCPSWPLGAHGVAMLETWTHPATQAWLASSLVTLRQWKTQQTALCQSFGWAVLPSLANFFVCQAGVDLTALRQRGIQLRDCTSFGLPGHVRLSVQTPAAQAALYHALTQLPTGLHKQ